MSLPNEPARGDQPGVALVTGAGSGLGRQIALDLARRGWKIAGIDQHAHGLEELELEFTDQQLPFAWAVADVRSVDALLQEVGNLEALLGPVDLLVASAGVASDTPAVGMDAGAIGRIIGINLIGVSNTIAAVLPGMLARKRGHLVAISSLASYWGLPAQMGYCASKAGLNALMQSLWLDVKPHGLHVTTICPGHTRTPQSVGMYHDAELMPVAEAAREVLKAIDQRKKFHAFPRFVAFQLRLLRWLPAWLREGLLARRMKQVRTLGHSATIPSNKIVPKRIIVAPSAMATSKSWLIPIDNSES